MYSCDKWLTPNLLFNSEWRYENTTIHSEEFTLYKWKVTRLWPGCTHCTFRVEFYLNKFKKIHSSYDGLLFFLRLRIHCVTLHTYFLAIFSEDEARDDSSEMNDNEVSTKLAVTPTNEGEDTDESSTQFVDYNWSSLSTIFPDKSLHDSITHSCE